MLLIRRLTLLALLAVLVAGPTSAQSLPLPARPAKAIQPQGTDGNSCSESPHPQAVSAEVSVCVDAQLQTDVQNTPGVHLDVTVLPENDPEMFAAKDQNQFASRAQPTGVTSWGPQPIAVERLETPPVPSESASSFPGQLPAIAMLPPTEVAGNTSPNLTAASTLDRKLARVRIRKQQEASLQHSRALQEGLDQLCQQMHLSTLECRLKLKNQKQSAPSYTAQTAKSYHQPQH